ncbi:MAG: hypothetical protein JJ902_23335 [Roseibium sp.]|nr:hypothetical protein [Roseibium sp.]
MSAIDLAKAHYQRIGRTRIEVPEWGPDGEPFVIYATPMTVFHREQIRDMGNAESPQNLIDTLIYKAQDENGGPVFTAKDRHDLLTKVDGRVVSRIALEIMAGPSDEVLEKNSETAGAD